MQYHILLLHLIRVFSSLKTPTIHFKNQKSISFFPILMKCIIHGSCRNSKYSLTVYGNRSRAQRNDCRKTQWLSIQNLAHDSKLKLYARPQVNIYVNTQCWRHTTLYAVLAFYLFYIMQFNISLWFTSPTLLFWTVAQGTVSVLKNQSSHIHYTECSGVVKLF